MWAKMDFGICIVHLTALIDCVSSSMLLLFSVEEEDKEQKKQIFVL